MACDGIVALRLRFAMNDIPATEAKELLRRRTFCELDGDWLSEKTQPGTFTIASGLVDEDGIGTMMMVKLLFRRSHLIVWSGSISLTSGKAGSRLKACMISHTNTSVIPEFLARTTGPGGNLMMRWHISPQRPMLRFWWGRLTRSTLSSGVKNDLQSTDRYFGICMSSTY